MTSASLNKYDVRRLKKIVGRLSPLYKLDCRRQDSGAQLAVLSSLLFMIAAARQLENKLLHPLQMEYGELAAELPAASYFMYGCYASIPKKNFAGILPAPDMVTDIISLLNAEQLQFILSIPASDFGLLYQCLQLSAREAALNRVQSNAKKIEDKDLIAVTQQYTPAWVCDFLLQNTLLPLWSGFSAEFARDASMHNVIPQLNQAHKKYEVEELKVLDPCCGSGVFLTRALPLLVKMYELTGKLLPEDALELSLDKNLAGCDIDAVALDVAGVASFTFIVQYFQRTDKCLQNLVVVPARNNGTSGDAGSRLGSLSTNWPADHLLSQRYHCLITNPPYLGRKLMDRALKQSLKEAFSLSAGDLSAAFLDQGCRLLDVSGRLGFITQNSILYLPTFEKLRRHLLTNYKTVLGIELGSGVFPLLSGEKVSSLLLVMENTAPDNSGKTAFMRLPGQETGEQIAEANISISFGSQKDSWYWLNQTDLLNNPKAAMTFWCPPVIWSLLAKLPALGNYCRIKQGLATGDNARFVRYAWDVDGEEIGNKYVPYVKGAGAARWLAPIETVVNWENNGAAIKQRTIEAYPYLKGSASWVVKNEDYYFREGITYSLVGSKTLSARKLPAGCIFDVAGSALFPLAADHNLFLAYLNSSFAGAVLHAINPTLNYQVGDLSRLPWVGLRPQDEQYLTELISGVTAGLQSLPLFLVKDVRAVGAHAFGASELVAMARTVIDKHAAVEKQVMLLDEETDRIFLAAIEKNISPDSEDSRALSAFCKKEKNKRAARPLLLTSRELALASVCALTLESFFQTNKAPAALIDCRDFSGMPADLLDGLKLLAQEAGVEPFAFLKDCLERHFPTLFSGCSPYRLLLPAAKTLSRHAIIILHVPHFRKIVKQGGSSIKNLCISGVETLKDLQADASYYGTVELAGNIMVDLGHKLSKMPDWTGKDLEMELSRYEGI